MAGGRVTARRDPRRPVERQSHPHAQAIVLLVLVTLLIIGLAAASTF